MFGPTLYLDWAKKYYGQVPYDLATSGMLMATEKDLGKPETPDDPRGVSRLRAAIATYNAVAEHEAIATLGTSHALWLAYATLLSPGDEVLVEDPGYEPLLRAAEGVGASVSRFERPAASGFALDPERIERAMTGRTRVVAVSNLHNPTGVRASDEELRAIARICEARRAHLLVDEVYAPFDALTDGTGVWRGSAHKLAPNIICAASLTKCYGLGPHRIGWMLGPHEVIARAEHVIAATVGNLPVQHANLGVHAFARIEQLATRARALAGGRRERVEHWVRSRPELAWSGPTAGLFGFATCRGAGDLLPALEAGARNLGVLVAAGTFFGAPTGFRLSWATLGGPELDEALTRLGSLLSSVA